MTVPGIFTVIEGIDGSGKSTQVSLLERYLVTTGKSSLVRHYPQYSSPLGQIILEMLKGDSVVLKHPNNAMVLQALFAVDRYEIDQENRNLLKLGCNLIFDRYYQSSLVYGQATGLDGTWLRAINSSVLSPDLAILLDLNSTISYSRRPERRDDFEKNEELLENVSFLYRKTWDVYARQNYHIISANQSQEAIHKQIVKLWETTYASKQETYKRFDQKE